ncbi:TonB-dependent receptor [Gluconacetobacter diazotrophicus PA1 5]|uniref:TonB-dependent receptor n=3 Tax=Gluconacetobacter diazotrophicus TaxID=33996 RepID=A0A7W4NFS4_GLUDI|nr:TonB-dependent receptor [Gluconacetobacter diazotrophicus]ACI52136.1 TonB-dependent receptor [Gluconacetobacter diazotrophicus PA1 5]MBB2156899.1 TonB-dependent receptor [Gluconacetobacter diazotrophicus]TWB01011.1 iron complex outermembrane receptor protein [Gluconacetobacter diazotrophicus]CAP54271.1 putative TonB-dependent receptor [Gluconacetobacter diazotrophicus PA1 5]
MKFVPFFARNQSNRRGRGAWCLLLSTALTGLSAAHAADPTPAAKPRATQHTAQPAPRRAAPAARPVQPASPPQPESIVVFGQGSTRQMTSVTTSMMRQSVPGTSPLKVLDQLPGVLYQSADPFGAYEYSSQVFMRGFSQNQLGFTLDDIPLGDQQFNNYNGLTITRALTSDNIAGVDVSQGAGGIDVASSSNLGGAIQFHSIDPSHTRGGTVEQTFGSNATFRTFVRLNSGDLNPTGTRFFVSYARTDMNLWKGQGYDYSDQVNAKLVQPLARDSSLKVFFDWSSTQQFDYQDMTPNYLRTIGPGLANYYPDYTAAYRAAQGIYPAQYTKSNDPFDAAYYAGTANRVDYLGGVTLDENFNSHLNWKTTVYGHGDSGYSTWSTPYMHSPNRAPLSQRVQNPGITRAGFLSAVTYTVARNTINAGVWYEYDQFTENRAFAEAPLLGTGTLGNPTGGYPGNVFAAPWQEVFNTNTFAFHLQDTYHVTHNLTLNAGFKSMIVSAGNHVPGQVPALNGGNLIAQGSLTASNAFLPQLSANWRFLPHHELFFDVSHNMRSYPEDGYGTNVSATPWTANQTAFQASKASLRPETDWVYEGGYRYTSPLVSGLVSLYRINFSNRLQLISSNAGINPITAVQNVGGVTTNGAEVSATVRPVDGLSIYNSFSYAHSTYDQNVMTATGLEPTRGKLVPNYPTFMYKGSIAYTIRNFNVHVDGNYISSRQLTYTNDLHVPGYFLANFGMRYNFGDVRFLKGVTASFNIYNLANKTYVATTNELGNNFTDTGYNYFLLGAPRQFFGSVSANF